jgi:malate dehydrogenase (oxaloacetate-decarboxylating)(NADP+)
MGMSKPVHLLSRGAEVEEIVNVTAIAVVDAQETTTVPEKCDREQVPVGVAD